MKKPTVAYIIGDFRVGGIPNFLGNLAARLQDDFAFHFIATDNSDINPRFKSLGEAVFLGHKWDQITKYLKEHKVDIVQYGNKVQYKQCAINAGVPIIIERTAGPRSCKLNRDGVTHVISSTRGTVGLIKSNYNGPLTTIYNGIDLDEISNIKPDRLHFKKDDFVVCYCARIGGMGQGFDVLIKAVLKARQTHDIKLVLIGDKPEHSAEDVRPKLRKLAKPMGSDCVFAGELMYPKNISIMAGSDIYVCPAKHHGISNSIIEACALKKPIIATNVGQTNEVVHDGRNGFLVGMGDVHKLTKYIIQLAELPKQRERLGHYGFGLIDREFNINKQSIKYKDLYNKLLDEAK